MQMLTIPLKVTKHFDISSALTAWLNTRNEFVTKGALLLPHPSRTTLTTAKSEGHKSEVSNAYDNDFLNRDVDVSVDGISLNSLPTAEDAKEGLNRLDSLRSFLCKNWKSHGLGVDCDEENILNVAIEYHAGLVECESCGLSSKNKTVEELSLVWHSAFEKEREANVVASLYQERINILFNIGAMESILASREDLLTKQSLTAAVNRFNMAASIYSHLRKEMSNMSSLWNCIDMNPVCLEMCEKILLAQGQACMFDMASLRPMHNVLAKIAMGAADIYSEALFLSQNRLIRGNMTDAEKWSAHLKALNWIFKTRAEYHESCSARENAAKNGKNGYGLEIARLCVAESLCEQAVIFCTKGGVDLNVINELKRSILDRKAQAITENDEIHHDIIPTARDIEPTRGQRMSKIVSLKKGLTVLPRQLFAIKSPLIQISSERYFTESKKIYDFCQNQTKRESAQARNSLAGVNLPQSLTAYTSSKQGLPAATWDRVEMIQKSGEIQSLKKSLWELKEMSEMVHSIYEEINKQLDGDMKLDNEFRERFPSFDGTNVVEVQESSRRNMKQCNKLLNDATTGDTILLQYLQKFDSDPKFKLLQYSKQQLDRLILPSKGNEVDTTKLSQYLVQLSNLLHERDALVNYFEQEYNNFDIKSIQTESEKSNDSAASFDKLVNEKLRSYQTIKADITTNIQKQSTLLDLIMAENDVFMNACSSSSVSVAGQNFMHMIEEVLGVLSVIKKQLEEGFTFYGLIVPRLNHLKQHISEMSVRLAVQRCDYEENIKTKNDRLRQEMEDAQMAKKLSDSDRIEEYNANSRIRVSGDGRGSSLSSINQSSSNFVNRDETPSRSIMSRVPNETGSSSLQTSLLEPSNNDNGSSSDSIFPSNSLFGQLSSALSATESSSMSGSHADLPPPPRSNEIDAGGYLPPTYHFPSGTNHVENNRQSPGAFFQSNSRPAPISVDDEKVANLVAMDFDAEKAVQALQKHDNDFNQALNELLSSLS